MPAHLTHTHDDDPQVPANVLLVKNMTMHGVFWGSYLQHAPKVLIDGMTTILQWLAEGKLSVQVRGRLSGHDDASERVQGAGHTVAGRS